MGHRQHLNLKWIWILGRMRLCEKRVKIRQKTDIEI